MAVFRVEKNRNYTVMSNVHLKDRGISLKAKGLLSVILSLPEDWNYTTRGLAAICKEGVDSIGAALRELESAGYADPTAGEALARIAREEQLHAQAKRMKAMKYRLAWTNPAFLCSADHGRNCIGYQEN